MMKDYSQAYATVKEILDKHRIDVTQSGLRMAIHKGQVRWLEDDDLIEAQWRSSLL